MCTSRSKPKTGRFAASAIRFGRRQFKVAKSAIWNSIHRFSWLPLPDTREHPLMIGGGYRSPRTDRHIADRLSADVNIGGMESRVRLAGLPTQSLRLCLVGLEVFSNPVRELSFRQLAGGQVQHVDNAISFRRHQLKAVECQE